MKKYYHHKTQYLSNFSQWIIAFFTLLPTANCNLRNQVFSNDQNTNDVNEDSNLNKKPPKNLRTHIPNPNLIERTEFFWGHPACFSEDKFSKYGYNPSAPDSHMRDYASCCFDVLIPLTIFQYFVLRCREVEMCVLKL